MTLEETDSPRERRIAVLLFVATLVCVFLVYGFQWYGANPLTDGESAWASLKFSVALMAILLSHEMGHYLVARAHGFSLSLPYFLPFPAAFGTFGAIIRLKSLPDSRTALLEMGAAGPLAGFVVAMGAIALGLPGTVEHAVPQMVWDVGLVDLDIPPPEPSATMTWLDGVLSTVLPTVNPGEIPLMVLANPPIMDVLGDWILGHPPGRYAMLDPLATAGWVGCLLTAINLIPIGQLDGGHIFNALLPRWSSLVSKALLAVALVAGTLWMGWVFWAVLLFVLGAWISLPVPHHPPLTSRAISLAVLSAGAFALTFMPLPVELESIPLSEIDLVTPEGEPLPEEVQAEISAKLEAWLAPSSGGR